MRRTGLILGGGGVVGIAWELGVVAGLREQAGYDPKAMEVIVGSSAGSAAGALLALGRSMDDLLAQQRRVPSSQAVRPPSRDDGAAPTGGTTVVPEAIMRLLVSGEGTIEERARAIGPLAMEAPTALSEDAFVASFVRMFGTDQWPDMDLRVTSAECESGASVLISKADGMDLARAVACSCAIPGYFPTIGFRGKRYMDGPRGGFYAKLVEEKRLEAVLFIGPVGALPEGLRSNPEVDALADSGLPVVQIQGGTGLASLGADLMDPAARGRAVDAGMEDGRAKAAAVRALWE